MVNKRLDDLKQEKTELQTTIDTLKQSITENEYHITKLTKMNDEIEKKFKEKLDKAERLQNDLNITNIQLNQFKEKLNAEKNHSEQIQIQINEQKEKITLLLAENGELKQERENLYQDIKSLQMQKTSLVINFRMRSNFKYI